MRLPSKNEKGSYNFNLWRLRFCKMCFNLIIFATNLWSRNGRVKNTPCDGTETTSLLSIVYFRICSKLQEVICKKCNLQNYPVNYIYVRIYLRLQQECRNKIIISRIGSIQKILNSQIQNADEINILLLSAHCLYE